MHSAKCWMPRAAVLVTAMIFLNASERVGSEDPPLFCPLVVEYSRAEQSPVAEEVTALPEGALIEGWLADYAVLREQARACSAL